MEEQPQPHGLEIEQVGEVVFARIIHSELFDEDEIQALARRLSDLLQGENCRRLVVSLAAVEGLGSAMMGKLIMIHKEAEAAGGRVALCGLAPALRRALEEARLAQFFHVYPDEQEAARSF
jgi:anti-sigma B factor antagonist